MKDHEHMKASARIEHSAINNSILSLKGSIDEQVWVSTLTAKQKSDLNQKLDMPPSLRRKMQAKEDKDESQP